MSEASHDHNDDHDPDFDLAASDYSELEQRIHAIGEVPGNCKLSVSERDFLDWWFWLKIHLECAQDLLRSTRLQEYLPVNYVDLCEQLGRSLHSGFQGASRVITVNWSQFGEHYGLPHVEFISILMTIGDAFGGSEVPLETLEKIENVLRDMEIKLHSIARREANSQDAGLIVDEKSRRVLWNGQQIEINAHADFLILRRLHESAGEIVSHGELLRTLKPEEIADTIAMMKEAPREVKDAVSHVRRGFKQAQCPYQIEPVRWLGYRLFHDE